MIETQEGYFVMRWKNFIPMMFAIIVGTNGASIFYQKQQRNTEQIAYDRERSDRKLKNTIEFERILLENKDLKQKLEDCNEVL